MERRRLNNMGFSLVEVLVSMAIIAVVLLPLLASLTSVNSSNQDLKSIQRGTTLAQNVVEFIKENELDDIKKEYSFGTPLVGYTYDDAYESKKSEYGVKLETVCYNNPTSNVTSGCYKDSAGNVKYWNNQEGLYSFVINGVQDGQDTYDVVARLNASPYYYENGEFNKTSLGSIAGLDPKRTAVISTTEDITNQAIEYYVSHGYGSADEIKSKLIVRMNITFSGDDSNDSGNLLLTASPTYIYNLDYEWTPGLVYQKTYNTRDDEHLERMYILYSQSSNSRRNAADEIVLNVTDGSNLGRFTPAIYIVKQNSSITSLEKPLDITSESGDEYFYTIFGNIRGNMDIASLNKSQYANMVMGTDGSTNGRTTIDYLTYTYVPSENIMLDDGGITPSTGGDNLADSRIYEVNVTVYKGGTNYGEVVTKLKTTWRE